MNNEPQTQDQFDRALARALQRRNAPETLAQFFALAAEAEQCRAARGMWPRFLRLRNGDRVLALPRSWGAGVLASSLLFAAMGAGAGGVHWHRARVHAEATREFARATRITEGTLQQTREQLRRAGLPLDE